MDVSMIYVGGIYHLGFAVFHGFFWRLFSWKEDLRRTSAASRAILQIENVCLMVLFVLVAALCFAYPAELLGSSLGRAMLAGVAVFWLARFFLQFVYLRVNRPLVHVLSVAFALGSVLFGFLALSARA